MSWMHGEISRMGPTNRSVTVYWGWGVSCACGTMLIARCSSPHEHAPLFSEGLISHILKPKERVPLGFDSSPQCFLWAELAFHSIEHRTEPNIARSGLDQALIRSETITLQAKFIPEVIPLEANGVLTEVELALLYLWVFCPGRLECNQSLQSETEAHGREPGMHYNSSRNFSIWIIKSGTKSASFGQLPWQELTAQVQQPCAKSHQTH